MKNFWIGLFLIGSFYFLTGFFYKITLESYRIVVDYKNTTSSISSKNDNAYSMLYITEEGVEKIGKKHFVAKGPYNISTGVEVAGYTGDTKPTDIIVKTAELRIINNDNTIKIINLNIDQSKWEKRYQEYKSGKRLRHRLWIHQNLKNVEIDFHKLKEIVFHIKFDVIYEDGATKSYWSKKVAYPKYTKEKYNPFIKNIMSV